MEPDWSDGLLDGDMFERYLLFDRRLFRDHIMVEGIATAILEDDLNKVKQLIEAGADVNDIDEFGNGAIYAAVIRNSCPILSYILSVDKCLINYKNFLGETPLLRAIKDNKFDIAQELILNGADVKLANNEGVTPMHLAVHNVNILRLLIDNGAAVDVVDSSQQTPLYYAVRFGYLEVVSLLLYHGADANIPSKYNYTPFMLAMEARNVELQEALFEYVDDYEDVTETMFSLSTLGLAMTCDSPFTKEMILRGADVNNVSKHTNAALFFILQDLVVKNSVNLDTFKLIWERMDYKPVEGVSVLGILPRLQKECFHGIVDIFINSDKIPIIAESVRMADDFNNFIVKCMEHDLPFEKFAELYCLLLCHGYTPNENDLMIIYKCWGYCDIFRISLHMDIRYCECQIRLDKIPTRLIYDVRKNVNGILSMLDRFVKVIKENGDLDTLLALVTSQVLDYFVYPPLCDAYLRLKKEDYVSLKMRALPRVPSLLELARNQTREHIKDSYQVQDSCQLYTLINDLEIPEYYKHILTFEVIIYRPTFNKKDFRKYVNALEAMQTRKLAKERLTRFAIKNAIVKY